MRTDTRLSLDFLERFRPSGPWVVTRIRSNLTGIDTACFTDPAELEKWLIKYNGSEKENIYFTGNSHVDGINFSSRSMKKLSRQHIKSMDWLHVDIDPDGSKDIELEQKRILATLNNPPEGIPQPTFIVYSGGGYQAFWRLDESFMINGDEALYEEAKLWNIYLEKNLEGDSCHNVDRLMRLPGTINWPTQRKEAKGRVPVLATLVESNPVSYDLNSLKKAVPQAGKDQGIAGDSVVVSGNVRRLGNINELGPDVPDNVKALIVQGANSETNTGTEYESRSDAVWYVVCELVRRNVDDDTIYSVITDEDFGISEHVRAQPRPEKYAIRQIERAHEFAEDPLLMEFNEKYALIQDMDGGKCRILKRTYDEATSRMVYGFQTATDFHLSLVKLVVGTGKTEQPASKWWLKHPKGRQFAGIVFMPGSEPPTGYLNMWDGFAYPAIQGNWQCLQDHVLTNVCGGDQELFDYVMNWMARGVQLPGEPGQTAIVMRGKQGVGKSFLAKMYGALFGHHYLATSNAKQITGQFTGHLKNVAFLFGDEAFIADDPAHVSALKTLITETMAVYEKKGVDAQSGRNCIKLMLASNEKWVVHADGLERRFLVLDVGEGSIQDSAYFGRIANQMHNGGFEAMMYDLINRDLKDFNVYHVPGTTAMQEQKEFSMTPSKAWVRQCLEHGFLLDGTTWEDFHPSSSLAWACRTFDKDMNPDRLGRMLRPFVADRVRLTREHRSLETGLMQRGVCWGYRFKPLEECRDQWRKDTGMIIKPTTWEEVPHDPEAEADEEGHQDF